MLEWAGFLEHGPSVPDSLLACFGWKLTSPIAHLGSIEKADFESALTEIWKIPDPECSMGGFIEPSFALRGVAKRLAHAARVYSGTARTKMQIIQDDQDERDHRRQVEILNATPQVAVPTTLAVPVAPGRSINVKHIADSCRSDTIEQVSKGFVDKCIKGYKRAVDVKTPPPAHCMPSFGQISYIQSSKVADEKNDVDFSRFGPYADRTQKKLVGSGLFWGTDGKLEHQSYFGPPSYNHWEPCWDVLATCLIFLNMCKPPFLNAYRDFIKKARR